MFFFSLRNGIDDEDRLREELKDLIDDNPIEEDDSDGEDSDGSKKRKKSDEEDFDDRLEDDDYDLIEENLGVKVERVKILKTFPFFVHIFQKSARNYTKHIFLQKRFKRLRKIEDEESEEEQEHEVEEERDAIANQLFEGSGDVSFFILLINFIFLYNFLFSCLRKIGTRYIGKNFII